VLSGRSRECRTLDDLLERVRAGGSATLVVRGEWGVGKSALLGYLSGRAAGCRVAHAAGAQSERELAFAGLHQLCAPMLDQLERLPGPQRDALSTAFALTAGYPPDRFLVSVAALTLLSAVAAERPLVCLVDDAQWLDRASAQALAFVARRLESRSIALVFAVREPIEELAGLPELVVDGLADGDARALLNSAIGGALDERIRDRIVAETRGNPLALLDFSRVATSTELAGGFGLPGALPLPRRLEESFGRQLAPLPEDTRRLLLLAAAEPTGEPVLVWRAAARLGIGVDAAAPAVVAGVCEFGARVRFRHVLMRSAVYRAASQEDRVEAHRALAAVTDPELAPDRRAWHRAHAASGPDEAVATELARWAERAQARAGLAAGAAFHARAAALTLDPARRAASALAAAHAQCEAGAPDAALRLLATAQAGPLDEVDRARVEVLRARIAALRHGGTASGLLAATRRLERLDAALAGEIYLDLLSGGLFAGPLGDGGVVEAAEDVRARPLRSPPETPRVSALLLDGLATLVTEGSAVATPKLQLALSALPGDHISREGEIRRLLPACLAAMAVWDDTSWNLLATRFAQLARDAGARAVLPTALSSRVLLLQFAGEFAEAASAIGEVEALTEATGTPLAPYSALANAAWQGREREATELIEAATGEVMGPGEAMRPVVIGWARGLLHNAAGQYEDALAATREVPECSTALPHARWVLIELIEAAARSGKPDLGAAALARLADTTRASGTDWGLGIEARSRALLSEGETAERLYREAIERLGRTRIRVELARTRLVYGEWLRRESRRRDAREQLTAAQVMFAAMGAERFAQRAGQELAATGATTRGRSAEASADLTAREAQVAQLARDGLSNHEIGSRLFLSSRTVEYHLTKVFAKLNVRSRTQLRSALSAGAEVDANALAA
jgi:DNA-binding CsgD family transcriptional regulator